MSEKTVDQRIVEMKFNNADFEHKVAISLATLQKLKEATKLENAGKGLEALSKSAHQLDLSHISDGLDQLNNRFSAFGIVGMTVMQRITNAAIDMGQKLASVVSAAPKDGWAEYELNADSVKTILNSAKDADGLPVTLEKVNEQLAALNEFSDQTIYSFSDMTNNIGKFTSAGVDLDSAVVAIKGVASVAALAGASANDASRAMYNFGQALGSGSVKLIDWKSIENANMATIGFKEQLIQTAVELGTVVKKGDQYVSTTKNMQGKVSDAFTASQGFNDSLSAQWMTAEVLTKTLAKYTDRSTALGEAAFKAATEVTTFSKMLDTVKESMGSGWMQTWQYIFGDFQEAKELWTAVYNRIDGIVQYFAGARNEILKQWHDAGGRNDLFEGFNNIWLAIEDVVKRIREVLAKIFPPIDATWLINITKAFKELTEKIKPVADEAEKASEKIEDIAERSEKFNQIVQEIIRGDWGNGQDRIDRLHEAGYAFENLQNAVNELLGCEKRYETTMSDNAAVGIEEIEVLEDQEEALNGMLKPSMALTKIMKDQGPVVGNLSMGLLAFRSSIEVAKAGLAKFFGIFDVGKAAVGILKAGLGAILNIVGEVSKRIYLFNSYLLSFAEPARLLEDLRLRFNRFLEGVEKSVGPLKKVRKAIGKVEEGFFKFKAILGVAIDYIKTFRSSGKLDGVLAILTAIKDFLVGSFFTAVDTGIGIFETISSAISGFVDAVLEIDAIQWVIGKITDFKDRLKDLWEALNIPDDAVDKFKKLFEPLKEFFGPYFEKYGEIVGGVFEDFTKIIKVFGEESEEAFSAFGDNGTVANAVDVIVKFKDAIKDIPEAVGELIKWLNTYGDKPKVKDVLPQSIADLLSAIGKFWDELKSNPGQVFADFVTDLAASIRKLSELADLGPLKQFVEDLANSIEGLNKLNEVPKILKAFFDFLGSIDYRDKAITALIGAAAIFVFRWSKVGKQIAKSMKGLTAFILNGGKVAALAVDKYSGFLKIAGAIGIIAASIWLLANVPAERFWYAVGVLVAAFGLMFGAIVALTKMAIPDAQMKAIGIAFTGMAASLLIIAFAIEKFSTIEWDVIIDSAKKMGIFIGMFAAAAAIAGKSGLGTGMAFLGISLGLLLLVPAIRLINTLVPSEIIKGASAILGFSVIMGIAARIAGNSHAATSFLGLSVAILLLIPSIKLIAAMGYEEIIKGGSAILAFMIMMGAAAWAAKGSAGAGKTFLGMAIAVGVIAGALYALSKLKMADLVGTSIALTLVINSLAGVVKKLSKLSSENWKGILSGVLAMALVLAGVTGAIYLIAKSNISGGMALSISAALSLMIATMSMAVPMLWLLSNIEWTAAVQAAANMGIFFAAAIIALEVLGEMSDAWGEPLLKGAELAGKIIHTFISSMFPPKEEVEETKESADTLTTIGEKASSFMEKIQGFIDMVMGIDDGVADKAQTLAKAILAFTAAEFIDSLTGFFFGEGDLEGFGKSIEALVGAVVTIDDTLAGRDVDAAAADKVIQIAGKFVELADAIPETGGLIQKLTGVSDLASFAGAMKDFVGDNFKTFLENIVGLGDLLNWDTIYQVSVIKTMTMYMVDLAKAIPTKGGIKEKLDGVSDLSSFGAQMSRFIVIGFKPFLDSVDKLGDRESSVATIENVVSPATQAMIDLASKIKMNEGVLKFFKGSNNLGEFGAQMSKFATEIVKFGNEIDQSTIGATGLSGYATALNKWVSINGDERLSKNNLYLLGNGLVNAGSSLKTFASDTGGIEPERLDILGTKLLSLSETLVKISAADYSGTSVFTSSITQLATSGINEFIGQFANNTDLLANAVSSFVQVATTNIAAGLDKFTAAGTNDAVAYKNGFFTEQAVATAKDAGMKLGTETINGIDEKDKDFGIAGQNSVEKYADGIKARTKYAYDKGKAMAESAEDAADDYTEKFYKLGRYAAEGYADGIGDFSYKASNAVENMVVNAYQAGMDAQLSQSPSKKYKEMGLYAITGYALGFSENISVVTSAVKKTAYAGIDTMTNAIDTALSLIDGDVEAHPTITPVVDLSNVSAAATQMKGLLNGVMLNGVAAAAAVNIANEHNASLVQSQKNTAINYSGELSDLIENTKQIINAVQQNRYAVIDGESAFDFFDRRLGMA